MTTTVRIVVGLNNQSFLIDADLSETVEVFQMQVYSVTGVEMSRQILVGLSAFGVPRSDQKLSELNVIDKQRIVLMIKPATPASSATSSSATSSSSSAPARSTLQQIQQQFAQQVSSGSSVALVELQRRCESFARHVLVYEQPEVRDAALAAIPLAELERRAASAMNDPSDAGRQTHKRDELLRQLLKWFKTEFFTWVNTLPCERCGLSTQNAGSAPPSAREAADLAGVVELHRCTTCGHTTRFPRYNHPRKLLETRRGRCGEWANCFTLCCRALNFDARHVQDWTDHVWTEVYSEHKNRWLHCDACENAMDAPLMYETGWGKKLSYVIAFARDEVRDVTRRYTLEFDSPSGVKSRRTACSEQALVELLATLDQRQRQRMEVAPGSARALLLASRASAENEEFNANRAHAARALKREELMGRQSGSLGWRIARGEFGASSAASARTSGPSGAAASESLVSVRNSSSITAPSSLVGALLVASEKTILRYDVSADGSWTRSVWRTLPTSASGKTSVSFAIRPQPSGAASKRAASDDSDFVNDLPGESFVVAVYSELGQVLNMLSLTPFASGYTFSRAARAVFAPHSNNFLLVSDAGSNTVVRFDGFTGKFIDVFAKASSAVPLVCPLGMAFSADGAQLYVCSAKTNAIVSFDGRSGIPLRVAAVGALLSAPSNIVVTPPPLASPTGHPADTMFVTSKAGNAVVRLVASSGKGVGTVAAVPQPHDIQLLPNGLLGVSSGATDSVVVLDASKYVADTRLVSEQEVQNRALVATLDSVVAASAMLFVPQPLPSSSDCTTPDIQSGSCTAPLPVGEGERPASGAPAEQEAPSPSPSPSKEQVTAVLVRAIFKQLTAGCGDAHCGNPYCKSSPSALQTLPTDPSAAAALSLQLAVLGGRHVCATVNKQS